MVGDNIFLYSAHTNKLKSPNFKLRRKSFTYGLFNDALSISNCMSSDGRMTVNNDLKACGRKRSCPNLRYRSGTEDSWCTGQDFAQAPPRCKSEVCTVSASLFSEHHSQCQDYTVFMIGWLMTAEQLLEWKLAAVPLCPQQIPHQTQAAAVGSRLRHSTAKAVFHSIIQVIVYMLTEMSSSLH
jgi:hypothetical protein